jgi:hypothetical protein
MMLALAGTNAVEVAMFGLVYTLAGKRLLSEGAFWAALVVVFVAGTALWVRVERWQGPRRDVLSRMGRIAVAFIVPIVAAPGVVLTPLYFLHEQLPREAGVADVIGRVMFLLLTSLTLMVLVNVAGIAFMTARALVHRRRRRPARPAG